jgi:hypothetical protein
MNERIRNLILAAQKQAAKETQANSFAYESLVYTKFAELIVRECSAFVYNYPEKYLNRNEAREICLRMEENFGVREE